MFHPSVNGIIIAAAEGGCRNKQACIGGWRAVVLGGVCWDMINTWRMRCGGVAGCGGVRRVGGLFGPDIPGPQPEICTNSMASTNAAVHAQATPTAHTSAPHTSQPQPTAPHTSPQPTAPLHLTPAHSTTAPHTACTLQIAVPNRSHPSLITPAHSPGPLISHSHFTSAEPRPPASHLSQPTAPACTEAHRTPVP